MYAAQNAISHVIRNVFGYNLFGRAAGDVARQTMYAATSITHNSLSENEKQQAILSAFQSVSNQFTWDSNNSRWISGQAVQSVLSGFEQQQSQHPVQHPYDLQVLSRMLVEVAMIDGRLSKEEGEWLTNMLDPGQGSLESISARPKLTPAELSEVSSGAVRESLLKYTWTLALCDEDFAASEKDLLMNFAQSMRLSAIQIGNVQTKAQHYILDNAMEYMFAWGGHDQFARQNIFQLASMIGLSQREAMEAEAKFQRRKS